MDGVAGAKIETTVVINQAYATQIAGNLQAQVMLEHLHDDRVNFEGNHSRSSRAKGSIPMPVSHGSQGHRRYVSLGNQGDRTRWVIMEQR